MKYLYHDAGHGGFVLARIDGDDLLIADFGVSAHYVDRASESLHLFLMGIWGSELLEWNYVEPEGLDRVAELFRAACLSKCH
jgi:hypothetical protein